MVLAIKQMKYEEDESKILSFSEIVSRIEKFLKEKKLKHWTIKLLESAVSDFQISKQEKYKIVTKAGPISVKIVLRKG